MKTIPHIEIERTGSSSDNWCVHYKGFANIKSNLKPPIEANIERNLAKHAWPHQYWSYNVQLAWEAWEESRKQFQPKEIK